MADALRDIAIAAPAAFLGGLMVGFFIKSRYTLTRKNGNGKEANNAQR